MPHLLHPCRYLLVFVLAVLLGSRVDDGQARENETIWEAVSSGNSVVLMRHALAPGTGDPENFMVDDCSTQRNLSDAGRQQARQIGDLFRENGVEHARVYSSQWCRCLETARLLGLGKVVELPVINSFFREFQRREQQTASLRDWLASQDLIEPTILVTHQVNITALTDIFPSSGEMIVIRRLDSGELDVLGRIATD